MLDLLSRFLLLCHYSIFFSLAVLCFIYFIRTRDRIVKHLLLILVPLFLHSFASLFYHLFSDELGTLFGAVNSAISLFLLVVTSMTVPVLLWGTSTYMLSLVELPEVKKTLGRRIITGLTLFLFFAGLYFIVFLNSDDWQVGLSRALNELFLAGSLFQFASAVTAMVYLKDLSDIRKKRLLRGIAVSFLPVMAFVILDWIFFLDSAYKLSYLSYLIFCILVYYDTTRIYVNRYEPEEPIPESNDEVCKSYGISDREKELIPLLIKGKSNKEISEILFISTNTVKTHIRNIYRKAGVTNRLQLLSRIRNHPEG